VPELSFPAPMMDDYAYEFNDSSQSDDEETAACTFNPTRFQLPPDLMAFKMNKLSLNDLKDPNSEASAFLLHMCKLFFGNNQLKKLPLHSEFRSEKRGSGPVTFMANNVLPTMRLIFGGDEKFFDAFCATSSGQRLIEKFQNERTEEFKVLLQEAKEIGRLEARDAIAARFDDVGVLIQEGCGMSQSAYERERLIVEQEDKDTAKKRSQAGIKLESLSFLIFPNFRSLSTSKGAYSTYEL
jgi:hypothetical protein